MERLDEAYGGSSARRLYLGTALVLGGVALFGLGGLKVVEDALMMLGVPGEQAVKGSVTIMGVVVPVALVGLLAVLPPNRSFRRVAGVGAAMCIVSVGAFWLAVPAANVPVEIPLALLGSYGVGVLVVLFGLIGTGAAGVDTTPTSGPTVSYQRTSQPSRQVPADGGTEEQDLSFPLEDDERRKR